MPRYRLSTILIVFVFVAIGGSALRLLLLREPGPLATAKYNYVAHDYLFENLALGFASDALKGAGLTPISPINCPENRDFEPAIGRDAEQPWAIATVKYRCATGKFRVEVDVRTGEAICRVYPIE